MFPRKPGHFLLLIRAIIKHQSSQRLLTHICPFSSAVPVVLYNQIVHQSHDCDTENSPNNESGIFAEVPTA